MVVIVLDLKLMRFYKEHGEGSIRDGTRNRGPLVTGDSNIYI